MTKKEFKQLIPEKSYVIFAGSKYKVANTSKIKGFVGIYDEPPSSHVDYINFCNLTSVKTFDCYHDRYCHYQTIKNKCKSPLNCSFKVTSDE